MAKIYDILMLQGETFALAVRWESERWEYAPIASITASAPATITTSAHNIPDGWRVAVVDAKGITQLNAKNNPPKTSDMRRATVVDTTTVEFNDVSTASFGTHTPNTGYIAWHSPKPLAGHTARMQAKDRAGGRVLLSLTSAVGGGITLDDTDKVIEMTISAEQTEAVDWSNAVYDLEIVSAGGVVTRLLEGTIAVSTEITTID